MCDLLWLFLLVDVCWLVLGGVIVVGGVVGLLVLLVGWDWVVGVDVVYVCWGWVCDLLVISVVEFVIVLGVFG